MRGSDRAARCYVHSWDETRWPEGRTLTAAELDRASYGGVVYMPRIDGHSAVVSSALAAASGARDLPGWSDTGLVTRESHHAARTAFYEGISAADRRSHIDTALAAAAAAGVGLRARERRPARQLGRDDVAGRDSRRGARRRPAGRRPTGASSRRASRRPASWCRRCGVHGLAGDLNIDGSFGSRTAALRAPYADADHHGNAYLSRGAGARPRRRLHAGRRPGRLPRHRRRRRRHGRRGDAGGGRRGGRDRSGGPGTGWSTSRWSTPRASTPWSASAWWPACSPPSTPCGAGPRACTPRAWAPSARLTMNPFAEMAAAGMSMALGSDSPGHAGRAVGGGPGAASTTATPGSGSPPARRSSPTPAAGGARPASTTAGYLDLGQPASFAIWSVGDLVVQAPDDRIQTWSTDPRSGTPGLPDLSPGAALPTTLRTVVRGRTVFERDGAFVDLPAHRPPRHGWARGPSASREGASD